MPTGCIGPCMIPFRHVYIVCQVPLLLLRNLVRVRLRLCCVCARAAFSSHATLTHRCLVISAPESEYQHQVCSTLKNFHTSAVTLSVLNAFDCNFFALRSIDYSSFRDPRIDQQRFSSGCPPLCMPSCSESPFMIESDVLRSHSY